MTSRGSECAASDTRWVQLVVGDRNVGTPDFVPVPRTGVVADLRKAVKAEFGPDLQHCSAARLQVCEPGAPNIALDEEKRVSEVVGGSSKSTALIVRAPPPNCVGRRAYVLHCVSVVAQCAAFVL